MKTDFNNKQWGVADFERYYSGKMPVEERHALEKAALDDPFLQDALDGYEFSASPVADIDELKQKLWPSADKTPVVALPWYKSKIASQLFKAAAVVIVVGGLGWFYMNNKNNQPGNPGTELVSNDVKQDTETLRDSIKSSLSQVDVNDSTPIVATVDQINIEPNNSTVQQEKAAAAKSEQANEKAVVEAEELARNEQRSKDKLAYNPAPVAPQKNDDRKVSNVSASKNRANQISGRVVNQQGEPVANAVVRNNADSRQAVSSDQNGNFVMNNANAASNSNSVPVEVNATGYERSNQNIANNSANNTIVLNEADDKSSDQFYFNSKTKKEKYEWNGRNSRIQLRNAKPLEGWDYFYYVMNDSISKNKALMQYKGRMILSFNVNDSGKVEQVTVKRSLNAVADSIAGNIILKSPVLELVNKQKKGEAIIKMY